MIDSARVTPGGVGAAGTLAISGDYTQTASGGLDIDLGGLSPGTQYDRLAVSGTAILGGVLDVALANRFQPSLGDPFRVVSAGTLSGNFSALNGSAFDSGLTFSRTTTTTDFTLTAGVPTVADVQSTVNSTPQGGSVSLDLGGASIASDSGAPQFQRGQRRAGQSRILRRDRDGGWRDGQQRDRDRRGRRHPIELDGQRRHRHRQGRGHGR